ncbi:MAG: hypothetical protein DRH57_05180, partial [Candidatus Cloacimonadota bacterium]
MRSKKLDTLPLYMKVTKKKINGVVYTPKWIVDLILDRVEYKRNIYKRKIIDPSCGKGNFLITIVKRFLKDCKDNDLGSDKIKKLLNKNIFGFDIDETSIAECKKSLDNIVKPYGID